MGDLVRGLLAPPSSRAGERGGLAAGPGGLRALGEAVTRLRPEAIVIASAHWVTTFRHYVSGAPRFTGILIPTGAPDLPGSVPYDYPGDPDLARALVRAGASARVDAVLTEEPALPPDPGTVLLLRDLIPGADVPIVPISLCALADLGETLRWGRAIGAAVRRGPKRVILALSGALAHRLVRGAERRPPPGGDLALLIGALGAGCRGRVLAYGPPSGRRSAVVTLSPG